uniref:Uncharacterized protein n=1 Tax=Anopheles culicifacies TaxID=139723 RepID=A0A182LTI7_9DIPT
MDGGEGYLEGPGTDPLAESLRCSAEIEHAEKSHPKYPCRTNIRCSSLRVETNTCHLEVRTAWCLHAYTVKLEPAGCRNDDPVKEKKDHQQIVPSKVRLDFRPMFKRNGKRAALHSNQLKSASGMDLN